jgi:anti-sigma regulatory factor (Ser/Thr protein kinase)
VSPALADAALEIPADAAFALTARQFVASLARVLGADNATVEDLRLAASELVANAVETGTGAPLVLRLARADGAIHLSATGTGPITDGEPVSRRQLLGSLFAGVTLGEDEVEVTAPVGAPDRP